MPGVLLVLLGSRGAFLNRTFRAWLLLLCLACASHPAPPTPPQVPRSPADTDQIALKVFADLEKDDVDAATRNFGGALAREVSPYMMRSGWRAMVDQLGPLKSTKIIARGTSHALETRTVALEFERGHARSLVGVNPKGGIIERLAIQPVEAGPPAPQASAPPIDSEVLLPDGGRAIEVAVGAPPWTLRGTLTLPARKGPIPGAILVHGSGPHDRDETVGPNKPFKDIAEGLAARGVAVLRYDKRTKVHAPSDPEKFTVEEEVITDALAALKVLRGRAEVQKDGLFVIGHSLGARLAPHIALRGDGVAGIVLLAPPARPLTAVIIRQLKTLGGATPEQVAALERQAEAIARGQVQPGETFVGVSVHYFLDLARRDSFAAARALEKPILILRGARDYQVTDEDFRLWQDRLAGMPQVSAITLPDLNHLFIAGSGPPGPAEYGTAGKVHPSVIARLAAFMKQVVVTKT